MRSKPDNLENRIDDAMLRDRAEKPLRRKLYGLFALGWRGSAQQWALQTRAHRLLALSLIPFLFIMQTIVSLELATTVVPSWHDTGITVRFVIVGFASGLGIVYFFAAILRHAFHLEESEENDPLDQLGKIALATVLVSAFVVALTTLITALGPPEAEEPFAEWTGGEAATLSWISLFLSKLVPQLLWFEGVRRNWVMAAIIGLALAIGVWFDHLAVLTLGIADGHLIEPGRVYWPSLTEFAILFGSIGLFALLALAFMRRLPIISVYETRASDRELTE